MPGRSGKGWWSALSHIAGGARRFFDQALTEYGPGRWQWPLWPGVRGLSELEAVKVEALAVSYPRQTPDGF